MSQHLALDPETIGDVLAVMQNWPTMHKEYDYRDHEMGLTAADRIIFMADGECFSATTDVDDFFR